MRLDFLTNRLWKDGICCRYPGTISLVSAAEFLSGFSELNHLEDVGTLSQKSSLPILAWKLLLLFLPACN